MKWELHTDRGAFAQLVTPFLVQNEAANNLQLGMAGRFARGEAGSTMADPNVQPLLATAHDPAGNIAAVAIRTPPFPIVLTALPADSIESLADFLAAMPDHLGAALAGAVGPSETSRALIELWARRFELQYRLHHRVRAYELRNVIHPRKTTGAMTTATMADLPLAEKWIEAFGREIHEPLVGTGNPATQHIRAGRLFLWRDDDKIVTMTCLGGETPNGVRVNLVYTPHEYRRRGYASNLVAQVSQHALDSGRKFCFLFADTANPTASEIYERMGYQPVIEYENYRFTNDAIAA